MRCALTSVLLVAAVAGCGGEGAPASASAVPMGSAATAAPIAAPAPVSASAAPESAPESMPAREEDAETDPGLIKTEKLPAAKCCLDDLKERKSKVLMDAEGRTPPGLGEAGRKVGDDSATSAPRPAHAR